MTEKKERILETALEMFANNGYVNTSTSAIAKKAQVSEGLIFRHFENKEGLLDEIVNNGILEMDSILRPLISVEDPKKVLSNAFDFILYILRNKTVNWHLQMSLKYQSSEIAKKYHDSIILKDLSIAIENSFIELKYPNPKAEAKLFVVTIGSLSNILTNEDQIDQEAFINFLKSKYNL